MSVVVSTEESVHEVALALEAVCIDAYTGSTNDAPDIVFHSVGPPPFDCCPMLAIDVPQLGAEITSPNAPAAATGRQASFQRVNMIPLAITILRCVPVIRSVKELPTTAEMTDATEVIRRDGWLLWNAIMHAIRNGEFKDMCSIIHLDRAVAVREQGGCAGWRILLRVELGGIPNPGPGP